MSEIGDTIKELRGKMSLREASEKIGISHTYLDTIEKGFDKRSGRKVSPSPDTLKLISEAYHYPYVKLLNLAGYIDDIKESEQDNFGDFITDPNLRRWFKRLPESDEEDIARLKKIWDVFKDEDKN